MNVFLQPVIIIIKTKRNIKKERKNTQELYKTVPH